METRRVTELISKAMAKSLNLEESCFLNQFGEGAVLRARFNYYSCCQRPDLVLGLKPHADGSGYTIILQDDVEGLQVHKDGKWFTVPTIPHALLVLMGDQMEVYLDNLLLLLWPCFRNNASLYLPVAYSVDKASNLLKLEVII